jgi:hypothetical protein
MQIGADITAAYSALCPWFTVAGGEGTPVGIIFHVPFRI